MKNNESGSALLLTLIALLLLSLLAFFAILDANTGVRISDNFETQIQATYAALAGLNHARVLVRGLAFNDLFRGPDGAYNDSASYLAQARRFDFRNPLFLSTALSLDISNPAAEFSGVPDDGLISTGLCGISSGTVLIPAAGIAFTSPNPYGAGEILSSRYFVRVTDNNGEASEVSGNPDDNPFVDGDGIVIVRSLGISRTFSELTGAIRRLNSVAVFEARFKRLSTFDAGPALVAVGTHVNASFAGAFEISGGAFPGIGTTSDPEPLLLAAAGSEERITGGNLPIPSIRDISGGIRMDRDRSQLLNPDYLWDFTQAKAPKFADMYFNGDQSWSGGSVPYLGVYDIAKPYNAPGQDPRVTVVNGNLNLTGGISGGGLLIVTGGLSYSGAFAFNGLVLVIGSGGLVADGSGQGIQGGLILASLMNVGAGIAFGTPNIIVAGDSRILSNREAVQMALGLIPVSQVGFREIAGSDP